MTRYKVRPLEERDFAFVAGYWRDCTPEDLDRMGVDPAKVPNYPDFLDRLRRGQTPERQETGMTLVWEVDGTPIGSSSLKDAVRGGQGNMHLHMWAKPARGKGHGAKLFCLSALEFYGRYELAEVFCEPRSSNPMPNQMLQKIGFPLVKTYTAASSDLSIVCELNRYAILKDLAQAYVRGLGE